jgi:hypothetical protein
MRICADIISPKEVQTLSVSTKKLHEKLPYEKAAHKMLVQLTPEVVVTFHLGD